MIGAPRRRVPAERTGGHERHGGRRDAAEEGETPPTPAVCVGCYVLAVIIGMYLLVDNAGTLVQILLWNVQAVLLVLLLRKLGARESSGYAMLFVVATSLMSVYVGDMARDDLTLQHRGERVTVTVVKEWRDPPQGRKAREYNHALERQDGSKVPGPAVKTPSDVCDVGQVVTVFEDPEGELRPRTPRSGATR